MVWKSVLLPFLRSNAAGLAISVAVVVVQIAYSEYCRRRDRQQEEGQAYSANRPPPRPAHDCHICYEELRSPLEILPCAHIFHRDCIVHWLKIGSDCPTCRRELTTREVARIESE